MAIEITTHPALEISTHGANAPLRTKLEKIFDSDGVVVYNFEVGSDGKTNPDPITLKWKIPAVNIKGVWKPTTDFNKRIQADWELDNMESRISIDSPIINLFGNCDENILTFACSNAINKLDMNARYREEDNCFYCHITFFLEQHYALSDFKAQLRFDFRNTHFSNSLKEVSKWWENFKKLRPAAVPEIANRPLYSTWYQFHQNLEEESLLRECRLAYELGYKAIVIDDGWQTKDSARGYDYTGDWQPDRMPEMAKFVERVHDTGMKLGLWYSVPFCGNKSKAYQRFKGKFLTEDHRWAPVFDPRYSEVREYLVDLYTSAVRDWNLDGLKLDFIDEFKLYKGTPLGRENGRDYASINEAVDRLLTDVKDAVHKINPEIFIEFRQKYTGPAMRKYGNMFRAFDCPGDGTMNRLRIADIKMLCGNTAVHADMVTWHPKETLEVAALHMINMLFGVPQLSMMLDELPKSHIEMIGFYTKYWNENVDVLVTGNFKPLRPLANYPLQQVEKDGKAIIGVYDDYTVTLRSDHDSIHFLNGQIADEIVVRNEKDLGAYECKVHDCTGKVVSTKTLEFSKGILAMATPPCGIVMCRKL